MKSNLLPIVTAIILFFFPKTTLGQAPGLGAASDFALFTEVGAINSTETTYVSGDAGTNSGAFNGFPPGTVTGSIHVADSVSGQAAQAVDSVYLFLIKIPCGTTIGTTLGNNQVLVPGIYCPGAASTLNGNLILDAQGNPDAVFIFKIDGAFATSTFSSVSLINSASQCNVYWQITGAFTLGNHSVFRGIVVVTGAMSLLEGSSLMGSAFCTAGAITLQNNTIAVGTQPVATITEGGYIGDSLSLTATVTNGLGPFLYLWSPGGQTDSAITVLETASSYTVAATAMNGCSTALDTFFVAPIGLPIALLSFTAVYNHPNVVVTWGTAVEINNAYYSVENSKDAMNWRVIGIVAGSVNSTIARNYSFTDTDPYSGVSYYRLKQTDFNGNFIYFNIVAVESSGEDLPELDIYPDPAKGILNLLFNGDKNQVRSLSIYDVLGKKIYNSGIYESAIDLSNQQDGIYFIFLNLGSNVIIKKFMLE